MAQARRKSRATPKLSQADKRRRDREVVEGLDPETMKLAMTRVEELARVPLTGFADYGLWVALFQHARPPAHPYRRGRIWA